MKPTQPFRKLSVFFVIITWMVTTQPSASAQTAETAAPIDAFKRFEKVLRYGDSRGYDKPGKNDAIIALGILGDQRAVPLLIEQLQNVEDANLRTQIVQSLGWLGSKESVPALEAALKDTSLNVRRESSRVLKQITGKEYGYDNTGEAEMRKRMYEQMEERRKKAAAPSNPEVTGGGRTTTP